MNATIYYFTGTGNSKRVAEVCKFSLQDYGYSVDIELIGNSTIVNQTDKKIIGFVFPVIALSAPRIVLKLLKALPYCTSPVDVFVIATKGSETNQGWAVTEPVKILTQRNFNVLGAKSVHMPDNWITVHKGKSQSFDENLLKSVDPTITDFIRSILDGKKEIERFRWPLFGVIGSVIIKFVFRHIGIRRLWTHFKTTKACTGCGKCAKICPTKSIEIVEARPHWMKTCEQCMRCVSFCPSHAIVQFERLFRGSKNRRYHEPSFIPE